MSVLDAGAHVPLATYGLLAAIAIGFVLSHLLAVSPGGGMLGPSSLTLWALGGASRGAVLAGEVQRLVLPWLLHGDLIHLMFNATALVFAGPIVERWVGRSYLLVVFFLSVIGGEAASVAAHPGNAVGIGASGGLMGLVAAAFVASRRLPPSAERKDFQTTATIMLVLALMPIATTSGTVDVAAHAGGAVTGLLVAAIFHACWRAERPEPPGRWLLRGAAALGVAATAVGVGLQAGPYATARGDRLLGDERHAEAAAWYQLGARAGHPRAAMVLGYLHRDGAGVPEDAALAVAYFRRAARAGEPHARLGLAELHEEGRGVPRDPVRAYAWYHLAREGLGGSEPAEQAARRAAEGLARLGEVLSAAEVARALRLAERLRDGQP